MKQTMNIFLTGLLAAFAVHAVPGLARATEPAQSPAKSPWVEGFNNKIRLIAGSAGGEKSATIAGIELQMPKEWKTYWRNPGEAGGIPPLFDWSGSENLGEARVLFPAPARLVDKSGATIGYKDSVIFPVEFKPKDGASPVKLKLRAEYGVCKDICVPGESTMELIIDPADAPAPSAELTAALGKVPRAASVEGRDPVLSAWRLNEDSGKASLRLEVADPGGDAGDAFLEAPDGIYVPLPKKVSNGGGRVIYDVDLSDSGNLSALEGKPLTVTLTGAKGQSEAVITLKK